MKYITYILAQKSNAFSSSEITMYDVVRKIFLEYSTFIDWPMNGSGYILIADKTLSLCAALIKAMTTTKSYQ